MVKALSSLILVVVGLAFAACGLWLLLSLAGALLRLREFDRKVPAIIVAHETIAIGSRRPIHRPTVRYAYEAHGSRRESNRHDLLQAFPLVSRQLGRTGRLPYTVGQPVMAHVDGEGEAILSFELQYASLLGPAGLMFLLIGVAFAAAPPRAALRRAAERRDRARGIIGPRHETSQAGLAVLTALAFLITVLTALVMTEAGSWSVPAAIVVAGFAAGTGALARLLVREGARRRPFSASRLRLSGTEWTLSRGRLRSPSVELALREETRTMGDDGPGNWTGSDLSCAALEAGSCPEGWRGTLRVDPEPAPIDELFRRRYWLVRVREGSGEAIFPL